MAHRGKKYIEQGHKRIKENSCYDLTMTEIYNLYQTGTAVDAIVAAYHMGVEAGARMTERKLSANC